MPPLIVIASALAIAGGFGALIGILIGGRRMVAVVQAVDPAPVLRPGLIAAPKSSAGRGREFAPKGYIGMLDHRLVLAGRPPSWSIDKILVAKPLAALVGGLLAVLWIASDPQPPKIVLGTFLVVLCFFVPDLLIVSRGQKRQEQIQNALADTLDQMTIAVEAGLGFEAAMAKAATNGRGPLAEEFIRTLQDMSIGRSRKDAYQAFSDRTSSPDMRRFTRAVVQADAYGIAIANVLRVQAGEMRMRRRQRAEEQAMKVPIKVLFPLVFCILPVLFIVLLTPAAIGIAKSFL